MDGSYLRPNCKKAAREKARAVIAGLRKMKLNETAKKMEGGIEETLTYCNSISGHWCGGARTSSLST